MHASRIGKILGEYSMRFVKSALLASVLLAALGSSSAMANEEYASSVIGFSSQWGSSSWGAIQALGAPDTFSYGDIPSAWAPAPSNGSLEFLSLGFLTPVYSSGAVIRETYGNGFVYQIDAIDTSGALHQVWSGVDTSAPGSPVDFAASWATTTFQTAGLKIYVDTNHDLATWEEIDSVKLVGQLTAPVPEPETYAMMLVGLAVLSGVARRRKS
jgi:hypothetical protein